MHVDTRERCEATASRDVNVSLTIAVAPK